MPVPNFMPVIGRDFDSIGQQQRSWAGFNADVENQNFARANAAQDQQNNYLRTVAEMQQRAIDQDAADQSQAQQNALQIASKAAADAESKRRFGIDTELKKAGIANETLHWNMDIAARAKAEKEEADTVKNFGENKASDIAALGDTFEKSSAQLEKARAKHETAVAAIQAKYPGAILDPHQKNHFIPKAGYDNAAKDAQDANSDYASVAADWSNASTEFALNSKAWEQARAEALQNHLSPIKKNGKWVLLHSKTGKIFGDTASPASSPVSGSDVNTAYDEAFGAMQNMGGWAGFVPSTPFVPPGSTTVTATLAPPPGPIPTPKSQPISPPLINFNRTGEGTIVDPYSKPGMVTNLLLHPTDPIAIANAAVVGVAGLKPPSAAAPPGRVKVKSPSGSIGTIPESQLDSAIQQGYELVK